MTEEASEWALSCLAQALLDKGLVEGDHLTRHLKNLARNSQPRYNVYANFDRWSTIEPLARRLRSTCVKVLSLLQDIEEHTSRDDLGVGVYRTLFRPGRLSPSDVRDSIQKILRMPPEQIAQGVLSGNLRSIDLRFEPTMEPSGTGGYFSLRNSKIVVSPVLSYVGEYDNGWDRLKANVEETVQHEFVHYAQYVLKDLSKAKAAGLPSWYSQDRNPKEDHPLLDIEFYSRLRDEVKAFNLSMDTLGIEGPKRKQAAKLWCTGGGGNTIWAEDRSRFFSVLKKHNKAKWKKAVSEFLSKVL